MVARLILLATILTASAILPSQAAGRTFGGAADVRAFLGPNTDGAPESFVAAYSDLNGDGRLDALVYLSGPLLCGSGGCSLHILANTGHSYREVTRTTISRPPISVLRHRSHGWRDISVWVSGGGITHGYDAVLRFDGRRYPGNPSMVIARKHVRHPAGRVVIARDALASPLLPPPL